MKIEERYKIFRQIMWDYNISPEDVEDVLLGRKDMAGHYNKKDVFIKLLESYPWFTILQIFSLEELKLLLSDDVVNRLRFKSLKTKYEFVQKRLHQIVPATE